MVQSVELLLDPAAEAAVRDIWQALIEAELPSAGRHPGPTNRPHITLAVAPHIEPVREEMIADASAAVPVDIRLGGVLVFGTGPFVVARLVVPSLDLLRLQHRVAAAAGRSALPHGRPDEWTPHVTIARRVRAEQLAAVLALATPPITGSGVAVRRWDGDARRDWLIAG